MRLVHSLDLFILGWCIWQQKQFRFLTILATGCFTCQHGRFIRAVPLGVSIPAQLRPPGRFLLWFWPVASGRRGWDVLHRPGHWLHQPALFLLHPKPQSSASSLPTRLWSVLPSRHPTNPSSSSPSKLWFDSYFFFPQFDQCSTHRACSATFSCWMGCPATLWARPTTPQSPPGAAALSLRRHCIHTPRPPSTPLEWPPLSPLPEMDTRLRAERAGRVPIFRRPSRQSAWAHLGGLGPAAAFSTWLLQLAACTLHHPTHTC